MMGLEWRLEVRILPFSTKIVTGFWKINHFVTFDTLHISSLNKALNYWMDGSIGILRISRKSDLLSSSTFLHAGFELDIGYL